MIEDSIKDYLRENLKLVVKPIYSESGEWHWSDIKLEFDGEVITRIAIRQ